MEVGSGVSPWLLRSGLASDNAARGMGQDIEPRGGCLKVFIF